jgi:hypothetical protein
MVLIEMIEHHLHRTLALLNWVVLGHDPHRDHRMSGIKTRDGSQSPSMRKLLQRKLIRYYDGFSSPEWEDARIQSAHTMKAYLAFGPTGLLRRIANCTITGR